MIKTIVLTTTCCLYYFTIFSQSSLSGIITNQKGEALPFVNILINNSQKNGVSTDIDGKFNIQYKSPIKKLTLSYIGYENLVVAAPFKQPLQIKLKGTTYKFEEVTVIAGENPAHRIIKQVVKNRDLNDSEKMNRYSCLTYNKMAMGYDLFTKEMEEYFQKKDTTKKQTRSHYEQQQKIYKIFEKTDLMMLETVTRRKFKKPHDLQEEVLLNRVSGTKKMPIYALATETQPFSFYQEEVIIFDESYLNPISKNSTKKYFFNLTDTLYTQQDTVFIIRFTPKKGKNFPGLEGVLYINSNQYAIQNVIASPLKSEHLINFEIIQKYEWMNNEHWFPSQLLFEANVLPTPPYTYMGVKMYGKSYIDSIDLHPTFDRKTFNKGEAVVFSEDVYSRDDSLWRVYQKEELTKKEKNTYQVIDSLFEETNVDKFLSIFDYIGRERFNFGKFDYVVTNALGGNPFEGARLGVGLSTNKTLSKHVEIGGYGAYGFRDKAWKYGANLSFFFDKNKDNQLQLVYQNDLYVPAEPQFIERGDFLKFRNFADIRDEMELKSIGIQTTPIKYLQFNAQLSQQSLTPLYDYQFASESPTNTQHFTELQLGFRYAFNEKFIRILGARTKGTSSFPILDFQFTKGFNNLLNGDWDYHKYLLGIHHTFSRKALGKTSYRIEAGYINNPIPYTKLFSPFGLGAGFRTESLGISQGFQTMEFYEFVSDRFVHLFFRQDFGTLLLKRNKFQPSIILEHNLAFGDLQQPDLHQDISFKTLEKGYFEAGLILEDLVRKPLFNMGYAGVGLGMYYRYGPNQNEAFRDNVAWGLKFSFSY